MGSKSNAKRKHVFNQSRLFDEDMVLEFAGPAPVDATAVDESDYALRREYGSFLISPPTDFAPSRR